MDVLKNITAKWWH